MCIRDSLTHVINFDIPNIPETYVHRIGRTGRAGSSGKSLSFCDHEEKEFLRDIQRLIKREIPVVAEHPFLMVGGPKKADPEVREPRQPRGPGRGGNSRGRSEQRPHPSSRPGQGVHSDRQGGQRSSGQQREQRPQQGGERGQGQRQPGSRPGQSNGGRPQQQRNDRPAPARGDRPQQNDRPRQPRPDSRPQAPAHSPGKPDYAKLTKELFDDTNVSSTPKKEEPKRTGLGRWFRKG